MWEMNCILMNKKSVFPCYIHSQCLQRYFVGGHDIQYDEDLQIFYHNPLRSTWIYSFSSSQWRKGPDLPETGCAKGTLFLDKGNLVYSGGARLRVNRPGESNQIYEYLPNATVYVLDTESAEGQWEVIKSIHIFVPHIS